MSVFSSPKTPAVPPAPEPPKVPTKPEVAKEAPERKRRPGAVGRKETILSSSSPEQKKTVLGG